jgi:hypothetical protein
MTDDPATISMRILRALGIDDDDVRAVTLELTPHTFPTVVVERLVVTDDGQLTAELYRYQLVPAEPEREVDPS